MLSSVHSARYFLARLIAILVCAAILAGESPGLQADRLPHGTAFAASTTLAPAAFASPEFQSTWARADAPVASGAVRRSWLWGPAPGLSSTEPFAQAKDGKRLVQYFDKARMELNEAVPDTSSIWRVTTGLLVNEMVTGRVQTGEQQFVTLEPATIPVAGDGTAVHNLTYSDFATVARQKANDLTGSSVRASLAPGGSTGQGPERGIRDARYVAETGHNIPDVFWQFMSQTGQVQGADGKLQQTQLFDWVYTLGYPITEAYWSDISVSGRTASALIQLYQRRTLTYVPSMPAGWQVQMGNVGQHYYEWRYQTPQNATGGQASSQPATPIPATGGFVGISGDKFVYAGQEVKLKGTNYWESDAPFAGTTLWWSGKQVLNELEKAKELGVNTVRISIPYDDPDTREILWGDKMVMGQVSPSFLNQLRQLLQISSTYGMKVILVLFDWYDDHPPVGTKEEQLNLSYLQSIVGAFANDDRILAWEVRNEPDNYDEWKSGRSDEVVDWIKRMSLQIRAIDPRHPISVGVGNYANLWTPALNGTTILSFVDYAALHSYDAGAIGNQIDQLRAHTTKPILLEEMGWPTSTGKGPAVEGATYDEPTQTYLYTTMLDVAKQKDIGGVVQWTLWDYAPGSAGTDAEFEEHFGLVRLDGTFKPAASVFRDNYTTRLLPSDTMSHVSLTP